MLVCAPLVLPALLDGVSSQQRVNNGVDGLLEVFYEDCVPCYNSLFYHIYITGAKMRIKKKNTYTNNVSQIEKIIALLKIRRPQMYAVLQQRSVT